MTVAAFLPPSSAERVKPLFHDQPVLLARSWDQFGAFVRDVDPTVAILDPSASGSIAIHEVSNLLRQYPTVPVVAYVLPTADNLHAVGTLSGCGLVHIGVHPEDGERDRLKRLVERAKCTSLARNFLATLEPRLSTLPDNALWAVRDLFDRPERYSCGCHIALEAGVPVKTLYRWCELANLTTPKKLVTAAKMLRAYAYLREPNSRVADVSTKLGYATPRNFFATTASVFGCPPSALRGQQTSGAVIERLLEWVNRPVHSEATGPLIRRAGGDRVTSERSAF